jgi:hypothetical protein
VGHKRGILAVVPERETNKGIHVPAG